jgi:hypothetical protein
MSNSKWFGLECIAESPPPESGGFHPVQAAKMAIAELERLTEVNAALLASLLEVVPILEHAEKCEASADDGLGERLRSLRRKLKNARTAIAKAEGKA